MKILLVNPPVSTKKLYGNLYCAGGHTIPQGLAYLAASIEKAGFYIDVLDCIVHNYEDRDLANYLKNNRYDIIGISVLTPTASRSFEVAKIAKIIQPHSKIVLGGPTCYNIFRKKS